MATRTMYDRSFIVNYPEGDSSLEIVPEIYIPNENDKTHTVVEGDTLVKIAEDNYGSPEPWFIIMQANEIIQPWVLKPGSVLIIPTIENE